MITFIQKKHWLAILLALFSTQLANTISAMQGVGEKWQEYSLINPVKSCIIKNIAPAVMASGLISAGLYGLTHLCPQLNMQEHKVPVIVSSVCLGALVAFIKVRHELAQRIVWPLDPKRRDKASLLAQNNKLIILQADGRVVAIDFKKNSAPAVMRKVLTCPGNIIGAYYAGEILVVTTSSTIQFFDKDLNSLNPSMNYFKYSECICSVVEALKYEGYSQRLLYVKNDQPKKIWCRSIQENVGITSPELGLAQIIGPDLELLSTNDNILEIADFGIQDTPRLAILHANRIDIWERYVSVTADQVKQNVYAWKIKDTFALAFPIKNIIVSSDKRYIFACGESKTYICDTLLNSKQEVYKGLNPQTILLNDGKLNAFTNKNLRLCYILDNNVRIVYENLLIIKKVVALNSRIFALADAGVVELNLP